MSYNTGPRIVTENILVYVDAGNTKSYPGTGESWFDLSGQGNTASRTNNLGFGGQVTYNTGGFFDFSVNNPAVTSGATSGNGFTFLNMIIPPTGSFSLFSVIRRNPAAKAFGDRETIFGNTSNPDGWRFGISGGGDIYYLIGGAGGAGYQEGSLGGSNLVDTYWHSVCVVFDRNATLGSYTVYGYIDGIISGTATISAGASAGIAFSNQSPGIGYRGCCDVFAGQIALFMAHASALTQKNVVMNHNAVKSRFNIL